MNAQYGKMLQDASKNRNIKPYLNEGLFRLKAAKYGVQDWDVIRIDEDEFLGLIDTVKSGGAVLKTPRATGFAILELTKVHMMKVHRRLLRSWREATRKESQSFKKSTRKQKGVSEE